MILLEVRCCCQPMKLLGWLPVEEYQASMGHVIRFAKMLPEITPGECSDGALYVETIELPVAIYVEHRDGRTRESMALKAEGMKLKKLKQIPGFRAVL